MSYKKPTQPSPARLAVAPVPEGRRRRLRLVLRAVLAEELVVDDLRLVLRAVLAEELVVDDLLGGQSAPLSPGRAGGTAAAAGR